MKFLKNNWFAIALVILVVAWLAIYSVGKNAILPTNNNNTTTSTIDTRALADYLTQKGFKFYGTFWCSYCNAQKDLFGDAASSLPYIECSTPDGKNQLAVCSQAGIKSYPTWKFPTGKLIIGVMTLQQLVTASGYPTPN